jgi:hypothetical protein
VALAVVGVARQCLHHLIVGNPAVNGLRASTPLKHFPYGQYTDRLQLTRLPVRLNGEGGN